MPGPATYRSVKEGDGSWSQPEEILSNFAGEPTLDDEGDLYFVHHFATFPGGVYQPIEADIYVACKRTSGAIRKASGNGQNLKMVAGPEGIHLAWKPAPGRASFGIYDLKGTLLELSSETGKAGKADIKFTPSKFYRGIYLLEARIGGSGIFRKIIFLN